MTRDSLS